MCSSMLGQILAIRAQVEELVIDEESLAYIGEIGQQASLRFAEYVIYKRSLSFFFFVQRSFLYNKYSFLNPKNVQGIKDAFLRVIMNL